jgi:hypothetical protein
MFAQTYLTLSFRGGPDEGSTRNLHYAFQISNFKSGGATVRRAGILPAFLTYFFRGSEL